VGAAVPCSTGREAPIPRGPVHWVGIGITGGSDPARGPHLWAWGCVVAATAPRDQSTASFAADNREAGNCHGISAPPGGGGAPALRGLRPTPNCGVHSPTGRGALWRTDWARRSPCRGRRPRRRPRGYRTQGSGRRTVHSARGHGRFPTGRSSALLKRVSVSWDC